MLRESDRSLPMRIALVTVGGLLFFIGILGWFLPLMPGWPLVIAGLAILAGEFVWARRLLDGVKERLARLRKPSSA